MSGITQKHVLLLSRLVEAQPDKGKILLCAGLRSGDEMAAYHHRMLFDLAAETVVMIDVMPQRVMLVPFSEVVSLTVRLIDGSAPVLPPNPGGAS